MKASLDREKSLQDRFETKEREVAELKKAMIMAKNLAQVVCVHSLSLSLLFKCSMCVCDLW